MDTIHLPLNEYQSLIDEIRLLKKTELLENVNRLIDLLYQDKYGLYMGEHTEDLTEYSISHHWREKESNWDAL